MENVGPFVVSCAHRDDRGHFVYITENITRLLFNLVDELCALPPLSPWQLGARL